MVIEYAKTGYSESETESEYWEDIPTQLFDLIKNNIKDENFEYTMTQGRLWLKMEIPLEAESDEK